MVIHKRGIGAIVIEGGVQPPAINSSQKTTISVKSNMRMNPRLLDPLLLEIKSRHCASSIKGKRKEEEQEARLKKKMEECWWRAAVAIAVVGRYCWWREGERKEGQKRKQSHGTGGGTQFPGDLRHDYLLCMTELGEGLEKATSTVATTAAAGGRRISAGIFLSAVLLLNILLPFLFVRTILLVLESIVTCFSSRIHTHDISFIRPSSVLHFVFSRPVLFNFAFLLGHSVCLLIKG
ncbi:hypothetical protein K1719_033917 [Acacia pycnantha]|nr:hypothetical protein K1719_033917 [Acacia pycnantha]